jgi:hypothetical protein
MSELSQKLRDIDKYVKENNIFVFYKEYIFLQSAQEIERLEAELEELRKLKPEFKIGDIVKSHNAGDKLYKITAVHPGTVDVEYLHTTKYRDQEIGLFYKP